MNFVDAVKSALRQYATFAGRARRSEFWWFFLFTYLVQIPFYVIELVLGFRTVGQVGGLVAALAIVLPSLATGARRLHDIGRSGWWQLIALVPLVGFIILIVWWATEGKGPNQYGSNPRASTPSTPTGPVTG